MKRLAKPEPGDSVIVSGESGAVGPGLAEVLMTDSRFREIRSTMGLNKDAVLLCFSTEGDTDPVNYKRVTGTV